MYKVLNLFFTILSLGVYCTSGYNEVLLENLNLFEGDIITDYTQLLKEYDDQIAENFLKKIDHTEVPLYEYEDRRLDEGLANGPSGGVSTFDSDIWPKNGNGIAEINVYISLEINDYQVRAIEEALDDLENKVRYLHFNIVYDGSFTEDDHIYVSQNGNSYCAAYVGYRGGGQRKLYLGDFCFIKGIIQHEFMHSLGFWHEQSRPDRDDYIKILNENIITGTEHNFGKRSTINSLGVEYDYNSVMHYGPTAFSKNGKPTIDSFGNFIGQRDGPSEKDILQMILMYKCDSKRSLLELCSEDCLCFEGEGHCENDNECEHNLYCIRKEGFDYNTCEKIDTIPTFYPSTSSPTFHPTLSPSVSPSTSSPTFYPTLSPSVSPFTSSPTFYPTLSPTKSPEAVTCMVDLVFSVDNSVSYDSRFKNKLIELSNRLRGNRGLLVYGTGVTSMVNIGTRRQRSINEYILRLPLEDNIVAVLHRFRKQQMKQKRNNINMVNLLFTDEKLSDISKVKNKMREFNDYKNLFIIPIGINNNNFSEVYLKEMMYPKNVHINPIIYKNVSEMDVGHLSKVICEL